MCLLETELVIVAAVTAVALLHGGDQLCHIAVAKAPGLCRHGDHFPPERADVLQKITEFIYSTIHYEQLPSKSDLLQGFYFPRSVYIMTQDLHFVKGFLQKFRELNPVKVHQYEGQLANVRELRTIVGCTDQCSCREERHFFQLL